MPTEAIFQFPPGLFIRPFPKEISRQDLSQMNASKPTNTINNNNTTSVRNLSHSPTSGSPLHAILSNHKTIINNGKDTVTETRRQSKMRTVATLYGVDSSTVSEIHGLPLLNRPSSMAYADGYSGRAVLRQPLTSLRSIPTSTNTAKNATNTVGGSNKWSPTMVSTSSSSSRSPSPSMGFMSSTFSPMNFSHTLNSSARSSPSRGYSPSPSVSSLSSGRVSPSLNGSSSITRGSSVSSPTTMLPHLLDTPSILYAERSLVMQNSNGNNNNNFTGSGISGANNGNISSSSNLLLVSSAPMIKQMFPPEDGEDDLDVSEFMKENDEDESPVLSTYASGTSSPVPPLSSSPMHTSNNNFVRPAPIHTNIPSSSFVVDASFSSPYGGGTTSPYSKPGNNTLQEELLTARANLTANERVQIREIRSCFTPYLFSDLLETYHFFASSKVPAYSIAVWTIAAQVFRDASKHYTGPLTTNPSLNSNKIGETFLSMDREYALSLCAVLSRCIAGTYNPNTENGPPPTVNGTWAPAKVAVQFACTAMEQQGKLKQILDTANNLCNTTLRKATSITSTPTTKNSPSGKPTTNELTRSSSSPLSSSNNHSRSLSPTGSLTSSIINSRASPLSLPPLVSISPMHTEQLRTISPLATTRAKYSNMASSLTNGSLFGTNRNTLFGTTNNETRTYTSLTNNLPSDNGNKDFSSSSSFLHPGLRYNPYNRKSSPPSHKGTLFMDNNQNNGINSTDTVTEFTSVDSITGGDPHSLESSYSTRSVPSPSRSLSPSPSQRTRSPFRTSNKRSTNQSSRLPPMPSPGQEPYLLGNAALISTKDIAATSFAHPAPPHCLLDTGQPGAIPKVVLRGSRDAPPVRMITSDGIIDGTKIVRGNAISASLNTTEYRTNNKQPVSYTLLYDGTYPAIRVQNDSLGKAAEYAIPKHYGNNHYDSVVIPSRYAYGPSTTYNTDNPRSRMPVAPITGNTDLSNNLRKTYASTIAPSKSNGDISLSNSPMKDSKENSRVTVFASVRPLSVSTRLTYTSMDLDPTLDRTLPSARNVASGLSHIRTISPLIAVSDTFTKDSLSGISAVVPNRSAAETGLLRARTAYTEYDKLLALTKRVP